MGRSVKRMPEIEKVITGLECCYHGVRCSDCPYEKRCAQEVEPSYQLELDALELLLAVYRAQDDGK